MIATGALVFAASLLRAATDPTARLVRGPYLQMLGPRSVTVLWNTDLPAACSLAIRRVGGSATVVDGGHESRCTITVANLTPGTQYAYIPRAAGAALSEESIFRTDDPDRPYAFLVLGDSGSGGTKQYRIRDRMLATPADFVLHIGDMIYPDGALEDFDSRFFRPYRDLIRRLVMWPALGNHDIHTENGAPWRAVFMTPANNPARNEGYYSFDVGNAHVAVINSNASTAPGGAQYTFLDRDLAGTSALWKFVVLHHSVYSSGVHGSAGHRDNVVPLFDQHRVDVVFMGHDHDYERTLPLRANAVVEPGAGTIYFTTGGGGDDTRSVGTSFFTAYSEAAYHYLRVAVDGGHLLAQMIREDGTVGDSVTLTKGGSSPPAPRCGNGLVDQATEQCDGDDHPACAGPCAADCGCAPICGDDRVDQPSEACDGGADAACPGLCLASCECGEPSAFLNLTPIADTAIEAGAEATWDHGATTRLQVDGEPPGIMYLKFDLSAVRTPVVRATLRLYSTNGSPDAGNVHPVGDSSWIEGDRNGLDVASADGPGLKWTDVDTNGDQRVDARDASPWVPELTERIGALTATAGQPAQVDVTAGFQRGPGVYTLALASDNGDGATYASREDATAAKRPRLRLELGSVPAPTSTTSSTTSSTTTTSTTSSSTTSSSATTTTSTTATTTPSTVVRPPTGTVEADVTVRSGTNAAKNYGTDPVLEADDSPTRRTFLRVRVSGLAGRAVTSARLRLHVPDLPGAPSTSGGRIHPISNCSWDELTVTWNTKPVIDGPELDAIGQVDAGDVVDFDVTSAITGDGVYCLGLQTRSNNGVLYGSREGTAPRPEFLVAVGE